MIKKVRFYLTKIRLSLSRVFNPTFFVSIKTYLENCVDTMLNNNSLAIFALIINLAAIAGLELLKKLLDDNQHRLPKQALTWNQGLFIIISLSNFYRWVLLVQLIYLFCGMYYFSTEVNKLIK